MATTVKTYIINVFNQNQTIDLTGSSDYKGCLYYLSGPGGTPNYFTVDNQPNYLYGGSSGYVMSGYIDFDYPYTVRNINIASKNQDGNTEISIGFTGPNIDPTNGTYPIRITGDIGNVFKDNNTTANTNIAPSETPIRVGYFKGALYIPEDSYNTYDQRGVLYQDYGSTAPAGGITGPTGSVSNGNLTIEFGNSDSINTNLGGGGFYGANGLTGGYGYSSGLSSGSNYGYGIVSLIPRSMISQSNFCINTSGSTGITGPSDMILYSLMGGGGGGGCASFGAGGGGSGDWISGFLNTSNTLNVNIGAGGTGGANSGDTGGIDGGNTSITYGSNTINCIGGKGGGAVHLLPPSLPISGGQSNGCGAGGAGFFGGGGGSYGTGHVDNNMRGFYSYGGRSYVSSWNNRLNSQDDYRTFTYNGSPGWIVDSSDDNYSGNGAGSVNYSISGTPPPPKYGTSSYNLNKTTVGGGGGGGGFWGGSGATEATAGGGDGNDPQAYGYGSGGGGSGRGAKSGGNGTKGFAIINYIGTSNTNIKIYKITSNAYFNPIQIYNYTGFWFFLAGNGDTVDGKSYKNMGHFLIKEDGVQLINFTTNNGYFTINVYFRYINEYQQTFTLKSTTQQNYAMIMFYN